MTDGERKIHWYYPDSESAELIDNNPGRLLTPEKDTVDSASPDVALEQIFGEDLMAAAILDGGVTWDLDGKTFQDAVSGYVDDHYDDDVVADFEEAYTGTFDVEYRETQVRVPLKYTVDSRRDISIELPIDLQISGDMREEYVDRIEEYENQR